MRILLPSRLSVATAVALCLTLVYAPSLMAHQDYQRDLKQYAAAMPDCLPKHKAKVAKLPQRKPVVPHWALALNR